MTEFVENEVLATEQQSKKRPALLIGYYNYTVVLTYIGMLVGFAGILLAIEGNIIKSLICLMLSGFCDMFDGAIASTRKRTKQEKRFGIQIDSLSDLICFGVFPAIIVNSICHSKYTFFVCGLYVLCALIRLSYFNVDEEERQDKSQGKREYYKGLPVTSIAVILPLFYKETVSSVVYLYILLAVAVAFVAPFKIKKPKKVLKSIMMAIGAFAIYRLFAGLI